MKVGYYEFEGEDRFPEEEEAPAKSRRLKLKYKPRDFKEVLLLKRLEEGQLIRQITDAELSSQGILRNDSEMPVIQQQGVDLKEHIDRIEELKEKIHKRDMQIIEERFSKGGGWDVLSRMLESNLLAGTHTLNVSWGSGVEAHECNLFEPHIYAVKFNNNAISCL